MRHQRQGVGTERSPDGVPVLSGQWTRDQLHGHGRSANERGVYDGQFVHGTWHGIGRFAFRPGLNLASAGRILEEVIKKIEAPRPTVKEMKDLSKELRSRSSLQQLRGKVAVSADDYSKPQRALELLNNRRHHTRFSTLGYGGREIQPEREAPGITDDDYRLGPMPGCTTYEGRWLHGEMAVYGRLWYPESSVYQGEFDKGEPHGSGTWTDGADIYEGHYARGERSGWGKLVRANGSVYEGKWRSGAQHGRGVETDADGGKLQASWQGGVLEGEAYYLPPEGSKRNQGPEVRFYRGGQLLRVVKETGAPQIQEVKSRRASGGSPSPRRASNERGPPRASRSPAAMR